MEEQKYSKEWLTQEEIKLIEEYPKHKRRNLLLFQTVYYGAFRISEILNLKPYMLKEISERYYIQLEKQKTEKKNPELQPIPKMIYLDLLRYIHEEKVSDSDYIFKSYRSKKRLDRSQAYRIFNIMCKNVGIIKKIGTHTLRRSRLTHLLDLGTDSYKVSKFARHSDIRTLKAYEKMSKAVIYDIMPET
jgi:integrase/recombinase XerD